VQLQINYLDWDSPAIESKTCYDLCVKHGKPVIVMEPVKGGTLARVPEKLERMFKDREPEMSVPSWAIRFAASLPNVMVVLSGMSNWEQMSDNLSYMGNGRFTPLSENEQGCIVNAQEALRTIDRIQCTACRYCTGGCPMQINIPDIFKSMNIYKMYGNLDRARSRYKMNLKGSAPSACIKCGQCEGACPQHLPIISLLEKCKEEMKD
jgi:predicted aldo/keto reductase-like oxidoreductase